MLTRASYVLFIPGRTSDWALGFLPYACFFCCLSLSINGLRPGLSNQNCSICIPHLHKIDLIENVSRNICYNRWPLLCLRETLLNCYLKLSPGCPAPFAQIKAYYFYYNLNLILVYTKQILSLTYSVNLNLRHNLADSFAHSLTRLKLTCWQRLQFHFSSEAWGHLPRLFRALAQFISLWLWN